MDTCIESIQLDDKYFDITYHEEFLNHIINHGCDSICLCTKILAMAFTVFFNEAYCQIIDSLISYFQPVLHLSVEFRLACFDSDKSANS